MAVPAPTRLVFNILFVALATVVLALIGGTIGNSASPGLRLEETPLLETLPGWGVAAFGVWMVAIVVVALRLPLLALALYGRYSSVRRVLLPYTLVLVVQIFTEVLFMRVFVSNIVVVTGLVYTSYRLWQLWSSRKYFFVTESPTGFGRSAVRGLLSLGLVFWTVNLLFLALIALPRVVES